MSYKTPLYYDHLAAGAKMVDFFGWEMPLHYGSQVNEHQYVRQSVGMFDVSHMTIVDVRGSNSKEYLRYLFANDVGKLQKDGKALYTCMLNQEGGVLDDLLVYRLNDSVYRLIVNCATREKDLSWVRKQAANFNIEIIERQEFAIISIQGPDAIEKVSQSININYELLSELQPFCTIQVKDWMIARTGYTGEKGLEIVLPAEQASKLWQDLLSFGVHPCGLGARDTLRLEAGMNLYGIDMDETVTPLESRLGWSITWDPKERDFIGRQALEKRKAEGVKQVLVGLVLLGKGVLRNGQKVIIKEEGEGVITSGSFSPTLGHGIALARIPKSMGEICYVEMRGKKLPVQIVQLPFVKEGKANFIFKQTGE